MVVMHSTVFMSNISSKDKMNKNTTIYITWITRKRNTKLWYHYNLVLIAVKKTKLSLLGSDLFSCLFLESISKSQY